MELEQLKKEVWFKERLGKEWDSFNLKSPCHQALRAHVLTNGEISFTEELSEGHVWTIPKSIEMLNSIVIDEPLQVRFESINIDSGKKCVMFEGSSADLVVKRIPIISLQQEQISLINLSEKNTMKIKVNSSFLPASLRKTLCTTVIPFYVGTTPFVSNCGELKAYD